MSERGNIGDHLYALRNANDGWAITIWSDGSWKIWRTLDAKYAEGDPAWLVTLSGNVVDADRAALLATGHKIAPPSPQGDRP